MTNLHKCHQIAAAGTLARTNGGSRTTRILLLLVLAFSLATASGFACGSSKGDECQPCPNAQNIPGGVSFTGDGGCSAGLTCASFLPSSGGSAVALCARPQTTSCAGR